MKLMKQRQILLSVRLVIQNTNENIKHTNWYIKLNHEVSCITMMPLIYYRNVSLGIKKVLSKAL